MKSSNEYFPLLQQLKAAKAATAKSKTVAEKSVCNKQIKEIISELKEYENHE